VAEPNIQAPGYSLARNSLINVLGQIVPVAVAFAAIPLLLSSLGRDRFGLLTLAWAAVGWFSVFDLGLGRAATYVVATGPATRDRAHVRSMALMIIAALFGLGCAAGAVAAATAPLLVSDVLKVPLGLRKEAQAAFIILSASLPFVLGSSAARGALEGVGRFGWVNAIRVPSAVLLVAAPVALLGTTHDLRVIVATITLNRACAFAAFYFVAVRALGPKTGAGIGPVEFVKRTMTYAAWTGATNAFGAILAWGYLDRYVVGAVVSVGSVALYATPLEIVTKLQLYPMALMAVFFPAFARRHRTRDSRVHDLEGGALRAVVLPLMPLIIGGVAASEALLTLYVGGDFARQASVVTQLLLVGAYCACIAHVPFTVLQACGRSDLTAKRHILQLLFYVPFVIGMTSWFGITGTAIAWLVWASSDALLLFYMVRRQIGNHSSNRFWWAVGGCAGTLLGAAVLVSMVTQGWSQIAAGAALFAICSGFLWFLLPKSDKRALKTLLGRQDLVAMEA
jgi:O-antigen/teichoic acid export membrane protein